MDDAYGCGGCSIPKKKRGKTLEISARAHFVEFMVQVEWEDIQELGKDGWVSWCNLDDGCNLIVV